MVGVVQNPTLLLYEGVGNSGSDKGGVGDHRPWRVLLFAGVGRLLHSGPADPRVRVGGRGARVLVHPLVRVPLQVGWLLDKGFESEVLILSLLSGVGD